MGCQVTRHRFYIGCTDKDGRLWAAFPADWAAAERVLTDTFSGFTCFKATGAWFDDAGDRIVHELSRVYECLGDIPDGTRIAEKLRDLANQSAVLYTREEVHGEFV